MPDAPALARFFQKTFQPDELARFVTTLPEGADILASVRREPAATFCDELAQALQQRGAIDDALRDRLIEERPRLAAELQALMGAPPPVELVFFGPGQPPGTPWPVLAPYVHPDNLGGRDDELAELLRDLDGDELALTLYAQSGAGKSSLLLGGLLPALGQKKVPAAFCRRPADGGLLSSLARGLVAVPPHLDDDDHDRFLDLVDAVGRRAGTRPVLVLDQVEEVFLAESRAPRERLGRLLHQTETRGKPCRWLLAYREEFHGPVRRLLHEHGRLHGREWPLGVLGAACFAEAILKPLRGGRYAQVVRIDEGDARRLAGAFARFREKDPGAPLTPELQVVLERLREEARGGRPRVLRVPEDVDRFVDEAIASHLQRKLEEVVDRLYGDQDAPTQRARRTDGLLLLLQLADEGGRCRKLPVTLLEASVGEAGRKLLGELRGETVWLVRVQKHDREELATLPHDRVAAEVRRLATHAGAALARDFDPDVLTLWRLATSRAASWRSHDAGAVVLDGDTIRRLRLRWDTLPRAPGMDEWWEAARADHARREKERLGFAVRNFPVAEGEPLRALDGLRVEHGLPGLELARVLRVDRGLDADRRDEILAVGPAGLSPEERARLLPALAIALAGEVAAQPEPERLWGALLAALDSVRPRPVEAEAAVVAAMRRARGEPPPVDPNDGSWSPEVAGRFEVGRFPEDDGPRQPDENLHPVVLSPYRMARGAVSIADYRAFCPGHLIAEGWPERWPAIQVNWYQARAYAAWRGAALPTEHQWEVACRGGDAGYARGACAFGGMARLEKLAVLVTSRGRLAGGDHPAEVWQVVPGAEHPLGLLHVHGNVFEWCQDWYEAGYPETAGTDPAGPAAAPPSAWRVLRGGSWVHPAAVARSACRYGDRPADRGDHVGFRLVLPQPAGRGS